MLDLGQPRWALVKGAGDVTTHGSPLGKWLLALNQMHFAFACISWPASGGATKRGVTTKDRRV